MWYVLVFFCHLKSSAGSVMWDFIWGISNVLIYNTVHSKQRPKREERPGCTMLLYLVLITLLVRWGQIYYKLASAQ